MKLQKGYGIRNSVPKGASTRTRLRVRRYERKIHESILDVYTLGDIPKVMEEAMIRYQHLLD